MTFDEWLAETPDFAPEFAAHRAWAVTFAQLAWNAGVASEREACAKVCDEQKKRSFKSGESAPHHIHATSYFDTSVGAAYCANLIRARRHL